jgi:phosphatidylinositol alpha-1,6-mannosyltransferase
MTTLLVSDIFPPKTGGSGRWFWEIYRRLPRESYLIAAGEDPRQDAFDRSHDLRVARVPLRLGCWGVASLDGLRGYTRSVRALRRVVARERVGMVHCGRCLPEGVMALALKAWAGVPFACYVHGEDVSTATESRELRWLARRVLHAAEFIVANSRNTERILLDEWGVPAGRVRVLYPGVDTGRFVPAPRDPDVRRRLGWHDRPVILTVGRLQKRKGHDRLIQALHQLRRSVPDVLYVIVGDGEERKPLQALVASEGLGGHVQFLGEVADEELIRCYQQCALFALPNRQVGRDIEGFGMVLLEAQACGKPVIAGASGGTAETMDIPATGRVVDCETPDGLAEVMAEMLSDCERLRAMGEAARAWVCIRFDWESLSRQASDLFEHGPTPRASDLVPA